MNNWLVALLVIFILISIFYFFYRRKIKKKKTGMDGTDKPPEDIYPLY